MKCYVHQTTDAVGVCSTCGRGVCNVCAVKVGGRLYCGDDADRQLEGKMVPRSRNTERKRGSVLMAGSLLAYLLGGIAAVLSCFVLFAGILAGSGGGSSLFTSLFNPELGILGPVRYYAQSTIIFIGIAVMVFGFIGIAAGFYLWRPAVGGPIVAIVFGILGLVVGFWLSSLSVADLVVDAWFVANGLVIALALLGLWQMWFRPIR